MALLLVAVVVSLLIWRGCRVDESRPPALAGEFAVDEIALTSPDLDLKLLTVRTTDHPGYTDWTVLFECREWGGCKADVRVRVLYGAAGEKHTLQIGRAPQFRTRRDHAFRSRAAAADGCGAGRRSDRRGCGALLPRRPPTDPGAVTPSKRCGRHRERARIFRPVGRLNVITVTRKDRNDLSSDGGNLFFVKGF